MMNVELERKLWGIVRRLERGYAAQDCANELRAALATSKVTAEPVEQGAGLTPEWLWSQFMDYCLKQGTAPANNPRLFEIVAAARALTTSKVTAEAAPWIACWRGSNPDKGWSILSGRDEVVWLGESISSEDVEAIVQAHNKCFDCEGTDCVMNCSGRAALAPLRAL